VVRSLFNRLCLGVAAWLCGCVVQPTTPPPPAVIVVCMDTLRADRLGPYGGSGRTPNLDHFATQSVVFTQAFAQATETLFSHAVMFSSRYVSELGPMDYRFVAPKDTPVLPEVLSMYGVNTAAFVSGGHMSEAFGLDRGFGRYTVVKDWGSLFHTAPAALGWLAEQPKDQAMFLYVHGYDAHDRYLKPTPFGFSVADKKHRGPGERAALGRSATTRIMDGLLYNRRQFDQVFDISGFRPRSVSKIKDMAVEGRALGAIPFSAADEEHIRGLYDGAVSYGDAWFGLLMSGLSAEGWLDRAWVVVLSDHGEELGENGVFSHRMGMGPQLLSVPLLVRPPGGTVGRTVDQTVGLIDLMPTLLELFGATLPAISRGRSLLDVWSSPKGAIEDKVVFAEGAMGQITAMNNAKGLTFGGLPWSSPQLTELLGTARLDGPAFEAWEGTDEDEAQTLRSALYRWRKETPLFTGEAGELDEERIRILQMGGYWGQR